MTYKARSSLITHKKEEEERKASAIRERKSADEGENNPNGDPPTNGDTRKVIFERKI